jgi:hypothetical protein
MIYEFPRGDHSWKLELEAFSEDIRLGRTPVPGLREGMRALEVVEKIHAQSGYLFVTERSKAT